MDALGWATTWVDRVWAKREPGAMEELMHPECVFTELAGGSWDAKGHEPFRNNVKLFTNAVPDFHADFLLVISEGEWLSWAAHCKGTIRDTLFGEHMVGQPFNMVSLTFGRIQNNQICRAYNFVTFNQPNIVLPGWRVVPLRRSNGVDPSQVASSRRTPDGLLLAYANRVWGGSRDTDLDSIVAPDVAITEANAWGYETTGIDSVRKNSDWFGLQMPSPELRVLLKITEGNAAALMFEITGRVAGAGFGRAAIGNSVTIRGMLIGTVENDLLVHAYSHLDFNHIGTELPAP